MSRPDSIRAIGLKAHLEGTRDRHNDRGYAEFVKYVNDGDQFGERIPLLKLARLFNTTRPTIERWLLIHDEESKDGDT